MLVYAAWADGSSWNRVTPLPLTCITDDAVAVAWLPARA